MTWQQLLAQKRLAAEPTSPRETADLLALARRSLRDARIPELSLDGRFGCAYDAARALATVVVRAEGYRIKAAGGAHYNTFQALRAAWGDSSDGLVAYLDDCRSKRNIVSYDAVGMVTETEVDALIERTTTLLQEVEAWLAAHHPELI